MSKRFEFSEEDKNQVKEAVKRLEKATLGEMVVYFARSSDVYLEACWKFAALLGISAAILMGALSWMWMLPAEITVFNAALIIAAMMAVGYLITYFIPRLRLSFIPADIVNQRVITKARDMFLQEEVFDTRDRIGILIYISEFEHQVQVIGDKGINAKIDQKDWEDVVRLVVLGIKSGHPSEGITNAIDRCTELLLHHGFEDKHGKDNELSDDMRIES